jgi:hypothetical protein
MATHKFPLIILVIGMLACSMGGELPASPTSQPSTATAAPTLVPATPQSTSPAVALWEGYVVVGEVSVRVCPRPDDRSVNDLGLEDTACPAIETLSAGATVLVWEERLVDVQGTSNRATWCRIDQNEQKWVMCIGPYGEERIQ